MTNPVRAAKRISTSPQAPDPQRLQALCELWRGADSELWVTLQGTSMTPAILPGSRLRLRCGLPGPAVGDVVAFRRGAHLVVHRLTQFDAQGRLICRGDANPVADAPVSPEEVVGVVTEAQPPGAWRRASSGLERVVRKIKSVISPVRNAADGVPVPGKRHASMNAMPPSALLVALARSGLTGRPIPERAAAELSPAAWEKLTALARAHDLLALVGAGAAASGLTPPGEASASFRRASRVTGLRADRAWGEIGLILGEWERDGIEAAVLKGVLLAARHYPDPGLRPFGDIDLLVTAEQRDGATDALIRLGYRCTDDLDAGGMAWCLENHYHWKFVRAGAFPVELHWSLGFAFPPTAADLDALWGRSVRVACPAGDVRALGPEDEVLALAAHMAGHCFRLPLRCHADFAAILGRFTDEQWSRLWERATGMGQGRSLRAVLGVGRDLGFLDLPDSARARVDGDRTLDLPFLARYAAECPFVVAPERWLDVRNAPSPRAALVRLFRVAFPRYAHIWTPQAAEGRPSRLYAMAWSRRCVRLFGYMRDLPKLVADCRRTDRVHRMFDGSRRRHI